MNGAIATAAIIGVPKETKEQPSREEPTNRRHDSFECPSAFIATGCERSTATCGASTPPTGSRSSPPTVSANSWIVAQATSDNTLTFIVRCGVGSDVPGTRIERVSEAVSEEVGAEDHGEDC
jgi:hypothetical protein